MEIVPALKCLVKQMRYVLKKSHNTWKHGIYYNRHKMTWRTRADYPREAVFEQDQKKWFIIDRKRWGGCFWSEGVSWSVYSCEWNHHPHQDAQPQNLGLFTGSSFPSLHTSILSKSWLNCLQNIFRSRPCSFCHHCSPSWSTVWSPIWFIVMVL